MLLYRHRKGKRETNEQVESPKEIRVILKLHIKKVKGTDQ